MSLVKNQIRAAGCKVASQKRPLWTSWVRSQLQRRRELTSYVPEWKRRRVRVAVGGLTKKGTIEDEVLLWSPFADVRNPFSSWDDAPGVWLGFGPVRAGREDQRHESRVEESQKDSASPLPQRAAYLVIDSLNTSWIHLVRIQKHSRSKTWLNTSVSWPRHKQCQLNCCWYGLKLACLFQFLMRFQVLSNSHCAVEDEQCSEAISVMIGGCIWYRGEHHLSRGFLWAVPSRLEWHVVRQSVEFLPSYKSENSTRWGVILLLLQHDEYFNIV